MTIDRSHIEARQFTGMPPKILKRFEIYDGLQQSRSSAIIDFFLKRYAEKITTTVYYKEKGRIIFNLSLEMYSAILLNKNVSPRNMEMIKPEKVNSWLSSNDAFKKSPDYLRELLMSVVMEKDRDATSLSEEDVGMFKIPMNEHSSDVIKSIGSTKGGMSILMDNFYAPFDWIDWKSKEVKDRVSKIENPEIEMRPWWVARQNGSDEVDKVGNRFWSFNDEGINAIVNSDNTKAGAHAIDLISTAYSDNLGGGFTLHPTSDQMIKFRKEMDDRMDRLILSRSVNPKKAIVQSIDQRLELKGSVDKFFGGEKAACKILQKIARGYNRKDLLPEMNDVKKKAAWIMDSRIGCKGWGVKTPGYKS